jgi:hypothetical protein
MSNTKLDALIIVYAVVGTFMLVTVIAALVKWANFLERWVRP